MSMFGDIAKEVLTQDLCQKLTDKIEKYPEAKRALSEIGLEMIDGEYCNTAWTKEYYEIFRNGARPIQTEAKWEFMNKHEDWYRVDWQSLCDQLGVKDPEKVLKIYQELFFLYEAPERHYHNLYHVYKISSEYFNSVYYLLKDKEAVHMAIWFHDAIYDTRASDNEERSAVLAKERIKELGLPDSFGDKVSDLILATKHIAAPEEPDAKYLVDMDLAIFGQSEIVFENYGKDIRSEYDWVTDTDFARNRKRVIKRFLNRPLIYLTDFFQNKYETQARKNLKRSLEKLN